MDRHGLQGDVGHGDKNGIHSYGPEYEKLLAPYREKVSLLEVGLAGGLSLKVWGDYFGPESRIYGVDLSVQFPVEPYGKRFQVEEMDATSPEMATVFPGAKFDVVIDDGSHQLGHQIATFNLLSARMNPGGLYVIEDVLDSHVNALCSLRSAEVRDLRSKKNRFDDILVIYRF